MLHVHRSNTTAALVDVLAKLVAEPRKNPAQPERVIVPSPGMETWLQQALAREHGVCANMRFVYPLRYLPELVATLVATNRNESVHGRPCRALVERFCRWRAEPLRWPILKALKARRHEPEFAQVEAFVATAVSPEDVEHRLYQLSGLVAHAFERYLYYRPEWALNWQRAPEKERHWQAIVWRDVCAALKAADPEADGLAEDSAHIVEFMDSITWMSTLNWPDSDELPERLFVFGVSTLPPVLVQLLGTLGQHVDVHLFVATPSKEWMSGVQKTSVKVREELRRLELDPEAELDLLHFDTSPPLLASFGTLAAEFQQVLESDASLAREDHEHFEDPVTQHGRRDLLASLQHQLIELSDAKGPGGEDMLVNVEVHRTHNKMRQVEVLRDRILGLLTDGTGVNDKPLEPRDVVVMCPDLSAFAPLIDAVFGGLTTSVPYAIADRTLRQRDPLADALGRVVGLIGSRFDRDAVLDVCALSAVRRRLGWTDGDHDTMSAAVAAVHVNWGLDAQHRELLSETASDDGSWEAGLDRLLLGATLDDTDPRLVAGLRPVAHAEGKGADRVASLAKWLDALRTFDALAREPATPAEWRERLDALIDATLAPEPSESWRLTKLKTTLASAFEPWSGSAPDDKVGFLLFREVVKGVLDTAPSAGAFLRGGVTFCDMLPMRSVPFRVVILLGMDDGVFPRADARAGVDRMEEKPRRPGDRSRREDDRYLMLEALTSAKERLLVIHQGFHAQSGDKVPPSPVVSELEDAIKKTHGPQIAERVVRTHTLQPYAATNFTRESADGRLDLRSFDANACEGARATRAPAEQATPWLSGPLPSVAFGEVVPLSALMSFAKKPAPYFHRERLGLKLGRFDYHEPPGDRLRLDGLQSSRVERDMIGLYVDGLDAAALSRESYGLPPGKVGDAIFGSLQHTAEAVSDAVRDVLGADAPTHRDLKNGALRLEREGGASVELTGRVEGIVRGDTLLRYDRKLRADALVAAWVEFLALCAVDEGVSELVCIGMDGEAAMTRRFARPEAPHAHLGRWLDALEVAGARPPAYEPNAALAYGKEALEKGLWPSAGPSVELDEDQAAKLLDAARAAAIKLWRDQLRYDADLARLFPDPGAVVRSGADEALSAFEGWVDRLVRPMLSCEVLELKSESACDGGDQGGEA